MYLFNFRDQEDADALDPASEGCDFSVCSFEQDFTDCTDEDSEGIESHEVSSDDENCGVLERFVIVHVFQCKFNSFKVRRQKQF